MPFIVKAKPSVPNTLGAQPITAEVVIISEKIIYLLPGVTKQGKELVTFLPFKAGAPSSPKSLRDNISKLRVFVWYDLPIGAKKEALTVLLQHFANNIDEVARVLGHNREYVRQLPLMADDEAEFELASNTKINTHVATQQGVAKDPMKVFAMDEAEAGAFLESTRGSWLARALDDKDPFILKTVETGNIAALAFLLGLGKRRIFNPEQAAFIIAACERSNHYALLPELCRSLGLTELELIVLLFPNEGAVKKMSNEQINWRINHLVSAQDLLAPTPWNPVFKALSPLNLAKIGTHLLPQYFIENLTPVQGVSPYQEAIAAYRDAGGNLIAERVPGKIIFAHTPIAEAREHFKAYENWSQRIAAALARQPQKNDADMMVLLIQTALSAPALQAKYWPEFLLKQIKNNDNVKSATIQMLMQLIETKQATLDLFEEENQRKSVPGLLISSLEDNEKTSILFYGEVLAFCEKLAGPNIVLTREHTLTISRFLNILVQFATPEEKAAIEALSFYKLVNAIAVPDVDKTNEFTVFEEKLLKSLLKHPESFLEKFAENTLFAKVLRTIVGNLSAVENYAQEKPKVKLGNARIDVPAKGSPAETAWIEKYLLAFEQTARELKAKGQLREVNQIYGYAPEMMARGLRIVHRDLREIQRTFLLKKPGLDEALARGEAFPDDSFIKEGVYVHFVNAKTRNDRTHRYTMEWDTMEAILKDIVRRVLILYASAEEWRRVDGNDDKLKDLFGRFDGYCIEGRTKGVLFDRIPGWILWQDGEEDARLLEQAKEKREILDDMDTLALKMKKLSDDTRDYLGQYGEGYTEANAKELLGAWYNGQSYLDAGQPAPLTPELLEPMIEALGVPQSAAESLLVVAKLQAAVQEERRNVVAAQAREEVLRRQQEREVVRQREQQQAREIELRRQQERELVRQREELQAREQALRRQQGLWGAGAAHRGYVEEAPQNGGGF